MYTRVGRQNRRLTQHKLRHCAANTNRLAAESVVMVVNSIKAYAEQFTTTCQ